MSEPLPLAAASRRLRRPAGRPRSAPSPRPPAWQAGAHPAAPPLTRVPGPTVAELWPIEPRLVDLEGAAAFLSISTWTVRDYVAAGCLPLVKLPGPGGGTLKRLLFDVRDLHRLVEDSKTP